MFHKNSTNSLAFFRFISVMLMYDVLQVGGILKLSSFVWWATANLSWGVSDGRGGGVSIRMLGSDDNCQSRHMMGPGLEETHTPRLGGSELRGGGARNVLREQFVWEVRNKTGQICNTGPNPASCAVLAQQALPWAQQKMASEESKVEDTDR